jgi:hypothetical protein
MSEPAKKGATYEDLCNIPERMAGEIIDGELIVTPRPSRKHLFTATALGSRVMLPYHFGEGGGPGGWIIFIDPKISLGEDILVPDLASGGRKDFRKRKSTTGSLLFQTGSARFFHPPP